MGCLAHRQTYALTMLRYQFVQWACSLLLCDAHMFYMILSPGSMCGVVYCRRTKGVAWLCPRYKTRATGLSFAFEAMLFDMLPQISKVVIACCSWGSLISLAPLAWLLSSQVIFPLRRYFYWHFKYSSFCSKIVKTFQHYAIPILTLHNFVVRCSSCYLP